MKLLLVSPNGYKATGDMGYGGIERLVWLYSRELSKRHKVTVTALQGSNLPEGVGLLPIPSKEPLLDEVKAFQSYSYLYRDFDLIHDFSMLHLAAKLMPFLKTINIFWHAPGLAKYEKAPYNIIALSEWAKWEFQRVYGQQAHYQQSIVIDMDVYKPKPNLKRNDRLITLGIMKPEKGNLDAAVFCKSKGLKLDIVGGRGSDMINESASDYEKEIMDTCDGKNIVFMGEVLENKKVHMLQSAMALIYFPRIPEVTSHKVMEAIACGCPVIVPQMGAFPEIVEHGKTGFLFNSIDEIPLYIDQLGKIDSDYCHKQAKKWGITSVVSDYEILYNKVKKGERW